MPISIKNFKLFIKTVYIKGEKNEKKVEQLLEVIRMFLHSKELLQACRLKDTFFIRNRVFSFQKLVAFIINLVRKTLQLELNIFTAKNGIKDVTKQAFSKARKKLSPLVFILLNKKLVLEFYTENEIKTFHGFRVLAVDGSKIQLPSSQEVKKYYGRIVNQFGKTLPMAQASTLFDVLNNITIDAEILPYKTAERNLAMQHFDNLLKINAETNFTIKDLFLFDRGYPSVELLLKLNQHKQDFLMRCPSVFVKGVNDAVKKGKIDQVVQIKYANLHKNTKNRLKQKHVKFNENDVLEIRVLIFKLKSGEKEILLTSLFDKKEFTPIELFKLYAKRWDTEENYKFHKAIAAVENFSGKSKLAVEQDFFATMFTCNIAMLLMQEVQNEINEVLEGKNLKYKYKINRNIGLGLLKEELIIALLSNQNLDEFCQKVKARMQKSLVPIRPGRSFPRKKSPGRNYATNRRSCL